LILARESSLIRQSAFWIIETFDEYFDMCCWRHFESEIVIFMFLLFC